jgi:tRNA1Val (adenine37-N6)-methyltransferase
MVFRFKQFSIDDSQCAMKIGTDGCLLGAWSDTTATKNILDIGTGSGLIALMLAQRSHAMTDAVEIDKDAYLQATANFNKSPWNERLNVFHSPIQEYMKSCKTKYDLIVSCPPYFPDCLKSQDKKRKLARHTDSLTFEDLLGCTKRLLAEQGRFCVIIPGNFKKDFCNKALIEGFFTTRITEVFPKEGHDILRVLLQMESKRKNCTRDSVAILDKDGKNYTREYKDLTGEFYINF